MVGISRIFKFLVGLNIKFDEVCGRILGRNPIYTIGKVFAEVRCKESPRQVMLEKKPVNVPAKDLPKMFPMSIANRFLINEVETRLIYFATIVIAIIILGKLASNYMGGQTMARLVGLVTVLCQPHVCSQ